MKRALTVFVLATLFACLSAFQGCYARAGGEENAGNATQGGATGAWVQVPGESIGGKWIPPHWAWSPAPNPGQPRPVQYQYTVPAYALVPAPNFGSVFADIIFLRPIGIAGLALGTAAAIVATPFALPSGSMGVVEAPYDFTFRRPLGVW
jgi:hypothetical protein